MGEIAVRVDGIGKRYRIAHERASYGRLTESLSDLARRPLELLRGRPRQTTEWLWALQDVSFSVPQGEVLGIVGRNGAGKSTLLKVLSRITEPTTGSAELRGRIGSLLEVGTGFHPELTGRENIFLSGSILGMRKREVERRFDDIVEFAEVERFLDVPVKRYSSGMSVRLGFAVAAHLETEILIVDEVLAVGDVAFQRKCLGKLENVSQSGRTVLFVSHNLPAVEALCSSAVLLDEGSIVARGTTQDVVDTYLERSRGATGSAITGTANRRGNGALRFTSITADVRTGSPSEIRLAYEGGGPLRNVAVALGLFTARGEGAAHLSTEAVGQTFESLPASGVLVCRLPKAPLLPGQYTVNVYCTVNGIVADWIVEAATIEIAEGDFYGTGKLPLPGYGPTVVANEWTLSHE